MALEAQKYASTRLYDVNGGAVPKKQPQKEQRSAQAPSEAPVHVAPNSAPHEKKLITPVPLTAQQIKKRVVIVLSMAVAAVALFAMIWSFAAVSQAYAGVSELEKNVEQARQRIKDLELQIDEKVNIDGILEGAEENGLLPPTKDYVIELKP